MCARTDSLHPLLLPFLCPHAFPKTLQMTEAQFKEASWDWVQLLPDTADAVDKWGDIGTWDVSSVKDFSFAFSTARDKAGGSYKASGNPNAATFVGTAISKWNTASATTLDNTFNGAGAMNADLSTWKVGTVTKLEHMFNGATKFAGTGLDSWITTSVTNMYGTFWGAEEMNSDLSKWSVGKVATLQNTFKGASKFAGAGLISWITTSLTTMHGTFWDATEMNSDLSKWSVGKVTTLGSTFDNALKFAGAGLHLWITTAVTDLVSTFFQAGEMNADLSGWSTARITLLETTFKGASKFAGVGLDSWDVSKVTDMADAFASTTSLTSCSKRKIVDASSWKSNSAFDSYKTSWAADACPVRTSGL